MGCLVGRRPTKQPITLLSVRANHQDAMALDLPLVVVARVVSKG